MVDIIKIAKSLGRYQPAICRRLAMSFMNRVSKNEKIVLKRYLHNVSNDIFDYANHLRLVKLYNFKK